MNIETRRDYHAMFEQDADMRASYRELITSCASVDELRAEYDQILAMSSERN